MEVMTFTEAQLSALIASVFWPFIRITALFVSVPLFSNRQLPTRMKVMLGLLIAFLIAPLLEAPPLVDVFSAEALLILLQQVAIGILMGFLLQFVFGSLAIAGELVGYSMKLGMAKMADPINGIQVPIVTTLYITLAMLVVLALDIHLMMLQLLVDSFQVFPVAVDGITRNTLWEVVGWATRMYEYGLLLALPIMGSLLLLDISLGVVSRASPQMNIFSVGFPLTLTAGLILIWLTLPAVLEGFIEVANEILTFIRDVFFARS